MTSEQMMGKEVAEIRPLILAAVGCSVCATGIACDIVAIRWGGEETDWKGARFGHKCAIVENGITPEQLARVREIQASIEDRPRDGGQLSALD